MTTPELKPALADVLAQHNQGVLATMKRNGRPQLSVITYAYDPGTGLIRSSITDGRAKTANIRRDPRVSFQVTNQHAFGYVVAEGHGELTPVATSPDDATVEELVEVYRTVAGEHPDWDEFTASMVDEGRLVLRIPVDYLYGVPAPR